MNDLDQRILQTGKKIASHEKTLHRQSEPNEHFPAREEGTFFKSVLKAAFESENESENCPTPISPTPISPTPISPTAESVQAGCPKAMHLRRAADELDKAGMADKAAELREEAEHVQAAFKAEEMRNRPVQVTGGQVEELQKTLAELREEVKQLKQMIEGLKKELVVGSNTQPIESVSMDEFKKLFSNPTEEIRTELDLRNTERNQEVAEHIAHALRDNQFRGKGVQIHFYEGVVTLSGQVDKPKYKELAEKIALEIPDVKQVVNKLAHNGK